MIRPYLDVPLTPDQRLVELARWAGLLRWVPGPNRTHLLAVVECDGELCGYRVNDRFLTACTEGPFTARTPSPGDAPPVCRWCWQYWSRYMATALEELTR